LNTFIEKQDNFQNFIVEKLNNFQNSTNDHLRLLSEDINLIKEKIENIE